MIRLRTERLLGDDQDRSPDDLQRGSDLVDMAMAWVIRSGKYGEQDSLALKRGCSGAAGPGPDGGIDIIAGRESWVSTTRSWSR